MSNSSSSTQPGKTNTESRLVNLPQELYICLIDFLDWQSIAKLRQSCSHFSNLWPKEGLVKLHGQRSERLHKEELSVLRKLEQEYWEQAEQAFLGYHSSSYTSSSLDPDLRARSERYSTSHYELPCYHCLQWLPSRTDSEEFQASSAFTRNMSIGKRNLGCKEALRRICIPCGLRTNVYVRGSRVKHFIICYGCQALFNQREDPRLRRCFGSEHGNKWKPSYYYCSKCLESPDIKNMTGQQFHHELRWKKYEDAMFALMQYRLENGKRQREKRDVPMTNGEGQVSSTSTVSKPRWCPIMKEMRLCGCQTLDAQPFSRIRQQYYIGSMRTWPVK